MTFSNVISNGGATGTTRLVANMSGPWLVTLIGANTFTGAPRPGSDNGSFAGQDRVLIKSSSGGVSFNNGDSLPQVAFFNDAGNFIGTGQAITFDAGGYEIVPVPEPATVTLLGMVALGALGMCRRSGPSSQAGK